MSSQVCTICHVEKDIKAFPLRIKDSAGGRKGEPSAVCTPCVEQRKVSRTTRKRKAAEEADNAGADGDREDGGVVQDLGNVSGEAFISTVKAMDSPMEVCARVDITEMLPPDQLVPRKQADLLAKVLDAALLLHWK